MGHIAGKLRWPFVFFGAYDQSRTMDIPVTFRTGYFDIEGDLVMDCQMEVVSHTSLYHNFSHPRACRMFVCWGESLVWLVKVYIWMDLDQVGDHVTLSVINRIFY